jgi:AbrB family looped-hinge helix DNA binding protein
MPSKHLCQISSIVASAVMPTSKSPKRSQNPSQSGLLQPQSLETASNAHLPRDDDEPRGGFGEVRQQPYVAEGAPVTTVMAQGRVHETTDTAPHLSGRLKLGPGGRVVVPADMREAMGLNEGDVLLATYANGQVTLVPQKLALKRAQDELKQWLPKTGLLSDMLIAERRREVAKEEDESRGGV